MKRDPLSSPKEELRDARAALERMDAAPDFDGVRRAWKNFLTHLEAVWKHTERAVQPAHSKFAPWQGVKKRQRKGDELLQYLAQARDAHAHSIRPLAIVTPASRRFSVRGHVETLEVVDNVVVEYKGSHPLEVHDQPETVHLLPVWNSGRWYNPPENHMGAPLTNLEPVAIGGVGLNWYIRFVEEVEATFFPDNPARGEGFPIPWPARSPSAPAAPRWLDKNGVYLFRGDAVEYPGTFSIGEIVRMKPDGFLQLRQISNEDAHLGGGAGTLSRAKPGSLIRRVDM